MTAAMRRFTRQTGERGDRNRQALLAASVGSIAVAIAVWWVVAETLTQPDMMAAPPAVARKLFDLVVEPFASSTLFGHAGASLRRWALGYLAAVLIGVPIGALVGWYGDARRAFTPIFETVRYIPPFAWIPLAILWFGPSLTAQALVVFVAAFPPIVINTQRAVSSIDSVTVHAARTLGASRLTTLLRVGLPSSSPAVVAGLRIAVSNGWMAIIGAELIVGQTGLGFLINAGRINGAPDLIVAGMITIGVVGVLMDRILVVATNPLVRWRKGMESGG